MSDNTTDDSTFDQTKCECQEQTTCECQEKSECSDEGKKCICIKQKLNAKCDLCFKLSTVLTGTVVDTGGVVITPATVTNFLTLCKPNVTICDACDFTNISTIILGIPLTIALNRCELFNIRLPVISPETGYAANVVVNVVVGANPPVPAAVDLQVRDGYLYIIITLPAITIDPDQCPQCIILNFTTFNFALVKAIKYCGIKVKCKPVIWEYGATVSLVPT
jgi:hypothetical protein